MPNIKSAKKRVTVIARRKEENRFVKSTLATYIKNFRLLVNANEFEQAEKLLPEVVAYIDSAQTKGILHKNAASRKVARLNVMLYKAKHQANNSEEVAQPVVEEEKPVEVKAEEKPKAKKTVKTEKEDKKEVTPKKRATKKAE